MGGNLKNVFNFILRHITWIILSLISLVLMKPTKAELQTLFFIIFLEALAIALSGIALFVYTKVNFINLIIEDKDKKLSITERASMINILGHIFIGVHLLVGLVVLGVYIAQFAN